MDINIKRLICLCPPPNCHPPKIFSIRKAIFIIGPRLMCTGNLRKGPAALETCLPPHGHIAVVTHRIDFLVYFRLSLKINISSVAVPEKKILKKLQTTSVNARDLEIVATVTQKTIAQCSLFESVRK